MNVTESNFTQKQASSTICLTDCYTAFNEILEIKESLVLGEKNDRRVNVFST